MVKCRGWGEILALGIQQLVNRNVYIWGAVYKFYMSVLLVAGRTDRS